MNKILKQKKKKRFEECWKGEKQIHCCRSTKFSHLKNQCGVSSKLWKLIVLVSFLSPWPKLELSWKRNLNQKMPLFWLLFSLVFVFLRERRSQRDGYNCGWGQMELGGKGGREDLGGIGEGKEYDQNILYGNFLNKNFKS